MSNTKTVDIDFSKVLNGLRQVQKELKKTNLKTGFTDSFNKDFTKTENTIAKLASQIQKGFSSITEVDSFKKDLDNLYGSLSKLHFSFENLDLDFSDIALPDNLSKQLKALEKEVEAINTKMKDLKNSTSASFGISADRFGLPQKAGKDLVKFIDNNEMLTQVLEQQTSAYNDRKKAVEEELKIIQKNIDLKKLLAGLEDGTISKEDGIEKAKELGVKTRSNSRLDTLKSSVKSNVNEEMASDTKKQQGEIVAINKLLEKQKNFEIEILELAKNYTTEKEKLANRKDTLLNGEGSENDPTINSIKTQALKETQDQIDKVKDATEELGITTKKELDKEADSLKKNTEALEKKEQITQSLVNKVGQIFGIAKAYELITRTVRQAFQEISALDQEFTGISVVTDKTIKELWDSFGTYNKMAQQLGVSTKDAISTSKLFYQQGLQTADVMTLTEETIKMAKIAGMDFETATNQMTAALRGFKLEMSDASKVNDTFSALAAKAAVDTQELSYALTKTASIANSAGMALETTSAFLTQMIETTREAPENIGTAMKTIVARFQELKENPLELEVEVDGEAVNANKVETALRSAGVALRDSITGQFRDLDDVFLELASKWDTLDRNTQRYIATISAGSRQQSRFLAMMDNYDRTLQLVSIAEDSSGESTVQFAKTMDSLDTKINQLKNSFEALYTKFITSETFKGLIDLANQFLGKMSELPPALLVIFTVVGAKIGKILLTNIITSFSNASKGIEGFKAKIKTISSQIIINKEGLDAASQQAKELKTIQSQIVVDSSQLDSALAKKAQLEGTPVPTSTTSNTKSKKKVNVRVTGSSATPIPVTENTTTPPATNNAVSTGVIKQGTTAMKAAAPALGAAAKQALGGSIAMGISSGVITGVSSGSFTKGLAATAATSLLSLATNPMVVQSLGKMALGFLKPVGVAIAGAIGPFLAPILIGVAAVASVAFIAWFNSAEQKAKRAAEKAKKEYEASLKKLEETQKKLTEAESDYKSDNEKIQEYEKLSKAIARTAEEESKFLSLSEEIAQSHPELIESYDAAGNVILKSIEAINEALEKQKENVDELKEEELNQKVRTAEDNVTSKKEARRESITKSNKGLNYLLKLEDQERTDYEKMSAEYRIMAGEQDQIAEGLRLGDSDVDADPGRRVASDYEHRAEQYLKAAEQITDALKEHEKETYEIVKAEQQRLSVMKEIANQRIKDNIDITNEINKTNGKEEVNVSDQLMALATSGAGKEMSSETNQETLKAKNKKKGNFLGLGESKKEYQERIEKLATEEQEEISQAYATAALEIAQDSEKSKAVDTYLNDYSNLGGDALKVQMAELETLLGSDDPIYKEILAKAAESKKRTDNLFNNISETSGISRGNLSGLDQMGEGVLRAINDQLEKIDSSESKDLFTQKINSLVEGLDIGDNAVAQKIMGSIDYSDMDSIVTGMNNLKNAGVNIAKSKEEIFELANSIELINGMAIHPDVNQFVNEVKDMGVELRKVVSSFEQITAAAQEYSENGELSVDTILQMIENGHVLSLVYDEETKAIKVNQQAAADAYNAKLDQQINELTYEKAKNDMMIASLATQIAIEKKKLSLFDATSKGMINITEEDAEILRNLEKDNAITISDGKLKIDEEFLINRNDIYNKGLGNTKDILEKELELYKKAKEEKEKALSSQIDTTLDLNQINFDETGYDTTVSDSIGDWTIDPSNYWDSEKIRNANQEAYNQIQKNIDLLESSKAAYENQNLNIEASIGILKNLKQKGIEAFSSSGKSASDAAKEVEEYITKLEKLFNLLQKLAQLEKERTRVQSQRPNLTEINDIIVSERKLISLSQQIQDVNQELADANKVEQASLKAQLQAEYGNYISFAKGYLEINYKSIAAMGESAEALEELIDKYQETTDAVDDYIEKVEKEKTERKKIIDGEKDAYISIHTSIVEVLKKQDQEAIDSVKNKYDAIKAQDQSYLASLRKNISEQRALRDKEKQQEDLTTKEKQLALLKRDTSGAYTKDILQLEQEIAEQRQSLADQEVDDLLTNIEEKDQVSSEAYDKEVAYLQSANERKLEEMTSYWEEAKRIMEGQHGDALEWLKKYDETYNKDSKLQREKWLEEWEETFAKAKALDNKINISQNASDIKTPSTSKPSTSNPSTSNPSMSSGGASATISNGSSVTVKKTATHFSSKSGSVRMASFVPGGAYTVYQTSGDQILLGRKGVYTGWVNKNDLVGYSKGGLVDQTGPVMVHGTSAKPEAFLNAQDTKLFSALKDVLSKSISPSFRGVDPQSSQKVGDVYYQIHFDIEKLDSDYSVDEAMSQMERRILELSKKNRVNSIRKIN